MTQRDRAPARSRHGRDHRSRSGGGFVLATLMRPRLSAAAGRAAIVTSSIPSTSSTRTLTRCRWRSGGSCRRSRAGSAARDGHDRRVPLAAPGPGARVEDLVDRRPCGAARVEHVVDDHDRAPVNRGSRAASHGRPARLGRKFRLVAVERDVDRAQRHPSTRAARRSARAVVPARYAATAMDADDRDLSRRDSSRRSRERSARACGASSSRSSTTVWRLATCSFLASLDRVKGLQVCAEPA